MSEIETCRCGAPWSMLPIDHVCEKASKRPSGPPKLEVLCGSWDMLEAVDDLRARIEAGEMDGIVLIGVKSSMFCGWSWAYREVAPAIWARMFAASASAADELLREGL